MKEYLKELRKRVGEYPLIVCAAGVIILNKDLEVLLQRRGDDNKWCIPGGGMELGETVEETAKREVFEETGLKINKMNLFGVYSGEHQHHQYPNGDEVYFVNNIFFSSDFNGELIIDGHESQELKFFNLYHLPENISPTNRPFINDFKEKFLNSMSGKK